MRRDARERREALIAAAAQCFGEAGFDVPLEDIADRAGVGRGTLYRNFPDRMALVLAIFEREVDRFGAGMDPSQPLARVIAQMVEQGASASHLFARLAPEMPFRSEHRDAFDALRQRLERLLEPVAQQARLRGELRQDMSAGHIVLAMRMVSGLLRPPLTAGEVAAEINRAVELLMGGLRPR